MTNDDSLRKGRQCVFDMHVHLVFVTKYRRKVFEDRHLDRLERIFRDVCESFDCRLEEFNGETDHVHLLVSFPPTVEVSRLVNSLKGVSSRYMRRDYPELAQHYWRAMERKLLRGNRRRCPARHVETIHRKPEPTSMTKVKAFHHRPKGRRPHARKR